MEKIIETKQPQVTTEPCGCYKETRTNETTLFITNHLCNKHKQEQEEHEKNKKEERYRQAKKYAEELSCTRCGATMGYVEIFDIAGNYFLCDECIK